MSQKNFRLIRRLLLIFSILLFTGCSVFLLYYLVLQPHHSKQTNDKYRKIYYDSSSDISITETAISETLENETSPYIYSLDSSYKSNQKDSSGVLLKFHNLIRYNNDIQGWLNIPGTKIDYPVLKDFSGGDFYLKHNFEGHSDKNGCLYIDNNCSVKKPSQNIVIHGHNMETTHMMFYELPQYKDINFYKKHPIITFDSIYKNADWKIIAFIKVSGKVTANGSFNYMQSDFKDKQEFLDFIYQIEMRSLYKCPVDVNEKDRLLMLSTCSYELDNYRAVVVARKIRKGEDTHVEVENAYIRNNVLYPDNYYSHYGGQAPLHTSFTDAMSFNEIDWYDGKIQVDSIIGKTVDYNDCQYEVTSYSTLKYIGCKNVKMAELKIPATIKLNGRTYDVTEISNHSLDNMTKLKYVKIGDNIVFIPAKLFIHCSSLEKVSLGESIEVIRSKAFYKLSKLKSIKFVSSKLITIDDKAFKDIAPKASFKISKNKFKKYKKLITESGVCDNSKFKQILP